MAVDTCARTLATRAFTVSQTKPDIVRRELISRLEMRRLFAITATFSSGVLTAFGDNLNNSIVVDRNAVGTLRVNGGAVAITGGVATVANTTLIQIFGLNGNDTLTLNEANGALPKANLFGGIGNDTLTGGSAADQLFGQGGNDALLGKGGNDFLFGGTENDTLNGGDADDQAFGEGGDDRMVWNPGDDTDLNEGGAGADTVEVNGGNGAEQFTVAANGMRVRFDRVNPAPFSIDIGTSENLVVNLNGGDDLFSATGNLAALIKLTVDGETGNDVLLGSNGIDLLLGGAGNDFIDGQQGNDVAFGGGDDDTFQWDPGDGSDVLEGQAGNDTLLFNGSNVGEQLVVAANGGRVRFTRDVANIVMDFDDVETLSVNALGGADRLTVNDLSGTDLKTVNASLASTIGGIAGDGAADAVIVNGRNAADTIDVSGAGTSISVLGLPAQVNISAAEGANDSLVLNALGGNDRVTATTLPAGIVRVTLDGGANNDTLLGSQGDDVFFGGDGNDSVFGDNGNDVAFLGAGNDTFEWAPGDGNDTVEGQGDADKLLFIGANASENINVAANGGRVLFLRDVANITMDLDDVENIEFRALGGADNVVVGDLSGTDLTRVDVDLRATGGTGDGAVDSVTVNGTLNADAFGASGDAGGVNVSGLATTVKLLGSEAANDRLTLNGQGGADEIDASLLKAGGVQLTINGGLGADLAIGSEGNDTFNGGDGDDVFLAGAGDDTAVWNPGDDNDIVEGQAGFDQLIFNGANVSENIDVAANGGRVRLFRNVANVVMDLNDTESITYNALGGADRVVLNNVAGTDLTEFNVNFAGAGGVGDGQADEVAIQGTFQDDVIVAAGDAAGVSVVGLAAKVKVTGAETATDRLTINALSGNDVVDASGMLASAIGLLVSGGSDDDVIIGGEGNDLLFGGTGDDVLIGGPGLDVLDGQAGDDIEIQ